MKFIHTADLHLGKIFHECSLAEDQRYMLDQLAAILEDASYRALLISGDVYDRAIPQAEAVGLFSDFLGELKRRRPDLTVLILPGNHDSASRLGFGRDLFSALGIHFITDPEDAVKPVPVAGNEERCAFFLLPFLNPGSLREPAEKPTGEPAEESAGEPAGEPVRSQAALAEVAAARLEKARMSALAGGADYAVLGAHLFTSGGVESGSERVFLGTAERVRADLFKGFDYVGLGHLHRAQQAGKNAWYAGSPLAYSFDEGKYEKVFLSVELKKSGAEVTPLPVIPQKKLRSLRGSFRYFFENKDDPVLAEAAKDYLEIILTGEELTENPLALLRPRFPFILSIKQEAAQAVLAQAAFQSKLEAEGGIGQDFRDFLSGLYGADTAAGDEAEKIRLFQELLREIEGAENDL
ncbi:MAG: exonuclease subunit SbcD [Treponema sp.]|jgi:exonuclease SbcD|nr:exonuclease subunit SbcD [Treponema sp.]